MQKCGIEEQEERCDMKPITTDEFRWFCGKLKDVCEKLEGYGFVLCHQGFLVNTRYIERIDGDTIYLTGGDSVPISSRKRKGFIEQYSQIISRHQIDTL